MPCEVSLCPLLGVLPRGQRSELLSAGQISRYSCAALSQVHPSGLQSVGISRHSLREEDLSSSTGYGLATGTHTLFPGFNSVHGESPLLTSRFSWLCRQPQCGAILRGSANSIFPALLADSTTVHSRGFGSPSPACKYTCAAGSIRKPELAEGCAATDAAQGSFSARAARNQSSPSDCR